MVAYVSMNLPASVHTRTYTHMQSSAGRWGDSGTDISVISLSVVPSHCHHLFVFNLWNRGKCVKSILHSLKEQPATTV